MNDQQQKKETQKCIDSPVYFYNNYCRKPNQKELTEEDYNYLLSQVQQQNRLSIKLRGVYKDPLLTPNLKQIQDDGSTEI